MCSVRRAREKPAPAKESWLVTVAGIADPGRVEHIPDTGITDAGYSEMVATSMISSVAM